MNRDPRRIRPLPLLCLVVLGACSTTYRWQEMRAGERRLDDIWRAVNQLARSDGFTAGPGTDRGLGIFESKWRRRTLALGRAGRHRLKVEVTDDYREQKGWLIRYCVEQQKVKDLRKAFNPTQDDWSDDGQDVGREEIFGARLSQLIRQIPERSSNPPRP